MLKLIASDGVEKKNGADEKMCVWGLHVGVQQSGTLNVNKGVRTKSKRAFYTRSEQIGVYSN